MSVAIIIHFYVSLLSSSLQLITPISADERDVRRTRPCLVERDRLSLSHDTIARPDTADKNHQESRMGGFHSRVDSCVCILISLDNPRDYRYFEETCLSVTKFHLPSITLQNFIENCICCFYMFYTLFHVQS